MAQSSNASSLMLLLNNAKYNAGMQASTQATAALNSGVGALSKTLGTRLTATIGALALRRVAAMLRGFATDSVKAASDAREMGNQFNVVFSNIAASADKAFRKTAAALGVADSTAKTLLGDTGNLLVGFRFAERESLNLSQKVTKLAGDLTSLTNVQGGTARATKLLVSGMLGHSRALKTLKISVNLAEAASKRAIKRIQTEKGLRHEQARAIFVLNESIRQSPKALNDLKKTWNEYANVMRRVAERVKEVKEIFGEIILKFSGLHPLVILLSKGLTNLTTWWKSLSERAKKVVGILALVAAGVVILVGTFAGLAVILPFFLAGWVIAVKLVAVVGILAAGFAIWLTIMDALAKRFLNMPLGDIWEEFINWAKRASKAVIGFFANFTRNWKRITGWFQDSWAVVWNNIGQTIQFASKNWSKILEWVFLSAILHVVTFSKNVLTVLTWIGKNWKNLWKNLGSLMENVLSIKITAVADKFKAFMKFLSGKWNMTTFGQFLLDKDAVDDQMKKSMKNALELAAGTDVPILEKANVESLDDLIKRLGGIPGLKDLPDFPKLLLKIQAARKKLTDKDSDPAKDLARVLTQSTAQRLTTSAREGTVGAANLTAQNRQRNQQISILEKISDNTAATNDKLDKAGLTPANLGI